MTMPERIPHPPWAVLIRGAPGVGKTTVARHVSEMVGTGAVYEVDRFRSCSRGSTGLIASNMWLRCGQRWLPDECC